MKDVYRSDEAALRLQIDELRRQLDDAHSDANERAEVHKDLERRIAELQDQRLKAAEWDEGVRRVGRANLIRGLLVVVLLAACAMGAYKFYVRAPERSTRQVGDSDENEAKAWFASVRARCTPEDGTAVLSAKPAPDTDAGNAYLAACHALSHRIDEARLLLFELPDAMRGPGITMFYSAVHPAADAGDPVIGGKVMELVFELQPRNRHALLHAGMAAYHGLDDERAEEHLKKYLGMVGQFDGTRRHAERALYAIEAHKKGSRGGERPRIAIH